MRDRAVVEALERSVRERFPVIQVRTLSRLMLAYGVTFLDTEVRSSECARSSLALI
jgi:hypothetical protein